MKPKHFFMIAVIAVLGLAACSDDEVNDSHKEVKIAATIDASTESTTKATFGNDGSGEFEAGDKYTLSFRNSKLGTGDTLTYKTGSTILYWDEISADGNPVDFKAWYPEYTFEGSSKQLYKVAGAATEAAKDLLFAPAVTVAKGGTVNLHFKHAMHKLVISLNSNYYNTAQLGTAVISLQNLKSDAMVDFNNGNVDETAALGSDVYTPKTGSLVSFIVAPQKLTANTEIIRVAVEGQTFIYKVSESLTTLESGKRLLLMLTLKEGGDVSGYTGEDFNSGGGYDGWK